ncbi:hypothetical protein F2Q68_00013006 [Brassica cretica]|uniref:ORC1/DEAH AAA+ ATPase domain-containing protein n=1 Tax=Brassica cretica TaxID=69181 RepID=A0A8S9HL60_BRACR|nr:hypothetical protein F2Q68_00013006 [Brassica cretica]
MRAVKEALHVSKAPSTNVCREDDEQRRVFEFVKGCLDQQKAGSLYICGCPGTGKSLSMEKVVQRVGDWSKQAGLPPVDTLSVNCTSLTKTTDIFSKVLEIAEPLKKDDCYSSPLHHLQSLFSQKQESSSRMMLIIADEMDFLITKDRGVLHDLFMLTTLPFSRCILIGVANAIDLADRFLPKLKSLNCKPVVITFRAYSKDQILRILHERLMVLPYVAFQSNALELCARKVAAASVCEQTFYTLNFIQIFRSALQILESDIRGLPGPESQGPTPADPVVRIDHMATALSKTFKSPVVDTIQSLPQHQQIIICSAAKAFRGTKKDATIGEGILKFGQARRDKVKRVSLRVDESDITFSLQVNSLLLLLLIRNT